MIDTLQLNTDDTIQRLQLIRSQNVGPKTFKKLLGYYGSPQNALNHLQTMAERGGAARPIRIMPEEEAALEVRKVEDFGAQLIFWDQPEYPKRLQLTPDAPPLLTAKGNIKLLNHSHTVAIVGSRVASTNGTKLAHQFSKYLSRKNIVVVSGLARGIDAAVHNVALPTLALGVIGCGIDVIYPRENANLYKKLYKDGLVITEYPFGTDPLASHFPQRNKILAALSQAVIVVEASLKSGSLITAEHAVSYNRKLFAVPGFPLDQSYTGSNLLIRQGKAVLLSCIEEVMDFLNGEDAMHDVGEPTELLQKPRIPEDCELDGYRSILHDKLNSTPVSIDDILLSSYIPQAVLHMLLLELEVAGRIEYVIGNKVALVQDDI